MSGHVVLLVVSCVLLIITLVLHIICLATPYYAEANNLGSTLSDKIDLSSYRAYYPRMDANYGFWKLCMNIYSDTGCYNFGMEEDVNSSTVEAPDWVIVCQALSIAGLAVGTLGVLFPLIWLCVPSVYLVVAASVSAVSGGIIIIIANIVFATQKSIEFFFQAGQITDIFGSPKEKYVNATDSSFRYQWGFGLDIATGIMCVLIGVVFAVCAALSKSGRLYISKSVV